MSVTEVAVLILSARTVKVAEDLPASTFTLVGTVTALESELDSDTTTPPDGAGPVRFTVPVPDLSPVIVVGLTDTLLSATVAGSTVTLPVLLTPE